MTYEDVKRIRNNPTYEECDNKELSALIDDAIEKQIPKRPVHVHKLPYGKVWAECICECCMPINSRFCPNCGQAIDWGVGK